MRTRRTRHERLAGPVAAAFVVFVAASCQGEAERTPALPTGAPTLEVTMREFAFDYSPRRVPAGRLVVRVRNVGRLVHRLSMLPLSEDVPPIEVQLRGSERRAIAPFAGIYDRAPGQEGTFAVDLVAGQRYAFICFVIDEKGSHAQKGMSSEFRAAAPS